jgi:hypothetical protein
MNQQFGAEITRGLVGTLTAGRAVTASSSLAKCERVRGGLPMAFPFCPHWLDAEPQSSNHALNIKPTRADVGSLQGSHSLPIRKTRGSTE